jgi:UrcA family protein
MSRSNSSHHGDQRFTWLLQPFLQQSHLRINARVNERKPGKYERRNAMSARSFITAIAAASIATVSLFSAGAHADPAERQVTVSLERFDLSKQSDADEVYARLQRAARSVCGAPVEKDLNLRRLNRECYEGALAKAVAEVDSTRVTALHESNSETRIASRTGRSRT